MAALALLAGGVSWLAKIGVIVATDGEITDTGAASFFYLLGAALLVVGAAAAGWWVASGRHVVLRPVAALAGVALLLLAIAVLDAVGKALADEGGYWYDELGILLMALAGTAAGWVLTARRGRRSVAG